MATKANATKRSTKGLKDSELTPEELLVRNKQRENIAAGRKAALLKKQGTTAGQDKTKEANKKADLESTSDFLEVPIEFFHHNTRFTDFGYTTKEGRQVTPPEGEMETRKNGDKVFFVKFVEHFRKWVNDPQGKGHIAKSACVFKTYSKKMVEYYRNHYLYNKTIFENAQVVYNTDSSVADIMETVAIRMVGTSNNDIIAKAIAMKIPVNADISVTRRQILERMAVEELELRKKSQQSIGQVQTPDAKGKGKAAASPY